MLTNFLALARRHAQRGHALEFGLLEPLLHAAKCLAAALQLGPWFRVAQQIRQGALGAAQDTLGEDCLGNRVALQFGRDSRRHFFRVDLKKMKKFKIFFLVL